MNQQQMLSAIPSFIEEHYPKNRTAADGGPPTPGRGEAVVLLTRFVMGLSFCTHSVQLTREQVAMLRTWLVAPEGRLRLGGERESVLDVLAAGGILIQVDGDGS